MVTLREGGMRTFYSEEPLRANALLSLSPLFHLRLEGQPPSKKLSDSKGVHRAVADLYRQGGLFDPAEKERKLFGVLSTKTGNVLTNAVPERE
jgi:hypothetical protein